jgi:hypothetical protein
MKNSSSRIVLSDVLGYRPNETCGSRPPVATGCGYTNRHRIQNSLTLTVSKDGDGTLDQLEIERKLPEFGLLE